MRHILHDEMVVLNEYYSQQYNFFSQAIIQCTSMLTLLSWIYNSIDSNSINFIDSID